MGRVMCDGWAAEWWTVWRAETNEPSSPIVPPEFMLRSKRGKLLDEISTRILVSLLEDVRGSPEVYAVFNNVARR